MAQSIDADGCSGAAVVYFCVDRARPIKCRRYEIIRRRHSPFAGVSTRARMIECLCVVVDDADDAAGAGC